MTLLAVPLLAGASALLPLALWSGSDTSLGQQLRAAFESAIVQSHRFSAVSAPQGDAPSLLVDEVRSSDGNNVSFRLTLFRGEPFRSDALWAQPRSCPMATLAACAQDAVGSLPGVHQAEELNERDQA